MGKVRWAGERDKIVLTESRYLLFFFKDQVIHVFLFFLSYHSEVHESLLFHLRLANPLSDIFIQRYIEIKSLLRKEMAKEKATTFESMRTMQKIYSITEYPEKSH